jgi:hypothetical protein
LDPTGILHPAGLLRGPGSRLANRSSVPWRGLVPLSLIVARQVVRSLRSVVLRWSVVLRRAGVLVPSAVLAWARRTDRRHVGPRRRSIFFIPPDPPGSLAQGMAPCGAARRNGVLLRHCAPPGGGTGIAYRG